MQGLIIPLPDGQVFYFNVDIVEEDIPLLVGLDVIRKHGSILDFYENTMRSEKYEWILPINFYRGHVFITLTNVTRVYTKNELTRLHRHFFHASAEKLFLLLRQCDLSNTALEVRKLCDEETTACNECREFGARPLWFRVSTPLKNLCLIRWSLWI